MKNFGELFIHNKDNKLHTSVSVEHEKERLENRGEQTSQKPSDKISDWLNLIEKTHMGHQDDPRVLERIKEYYFRENVIKEEDIPESAFLLEQRIARERGHGTIEITDSYRKEKSNEIINGQKESLNKWITYLSSQDAIYPMWAKYWAFNSILGMGKFEKTEDKETGIEKAQFKKRAKDTVASFPPLNPRALAMTIGVIISKAEENSKDKDKRIDIDNVSVKLDDAKFKELLNTENFSKIYCQFLMEMPEYSTEGLRETRGKWVTYKQDSEPDELVKSLEGYPLEWCTANIDTARTQLQGGDFHVYYSINELGEEKIPRVAIRMENNKIAEVRGIAHDQNIDPYIGDVIKEKMSKFPDGKEYEKKSTDMKNLTEIHNKIEKGEKLNKEELKFIYEVDNSIEGFGYQEDPRIQELREKRNLKEDLPIIFECSKDQIIYNVSELNKNTKAYIGEWSLEIMKKIPDNVEYLYESFPEKKIYKKTIGLTTKTSEEYTKKLEIEGYKISGDAKDILNKLESLKQNENIDLVSFSVEQLGLPSGATLQEIHDRAKEFGLELCPPQVGPELRLNYKNQPRGEYLIIAMESIGDHVDCPRLFNVGRDGSVLWLNDGLGDLDIDWGSGNLFVFRFRKDTLNLES